MKRIFKSLAGRKSPSPRRTRSSRHRRSSRRADVRDHDQGDGPPELVPLTFLGYQHLPDGTLHPVYAAPQPATYDPNQHTTGEQYQNDAGINDDELVDSQHFCFKCGKARSKQYHMDNPIKPGSKAPASCCSRCRKKNTDTELSSKYLQHFCTDCGRVRSRSYHREHPVRAGHKPRPNYCLSCRAHREEDTRVDDGWEDLDAGESNPALPRLKTSARNGGAVTEDELIASSDSPEDDGLDRFSRNTHGRRSLKKPAKLSVPATSSRKPSRVSVKSTRSLQASTEGTPPTPPQTPPTHLRTRKPAEKRGLEKVAASAVSQITVSSTGTASDRSMVVPPHGDDCKSHVHVVYIHPPCYHHGHDDSNQAGQEPAKARSSRGRRSDSNTSSASSKQSRRVVFATPEVSSRHEADADYDRTAVPENHEDPFDFGLSMGSSRDSPDPWGSSSDRRPRRSPTPGPMPVNFDSSSGDSSSEYLNSPSEYRPSRMDSHSPPPQYRAPPPKVFTPDEIRRLWEQGPQLEHPRRRQAQTADRRYNGPAPARGPSSSLNRGDPATNQRSFSAGNYPSGFGDGSQSSSYSNRGNTRPDNPGAADYRASDYRRASDGWYKNDENIDPKTRYANSGTSRTSQSRSRDGPSQQSANMYNTNRTNENGNARPSESRGSRSSENNNTNMYNMYNNSQSNEYSNTRPSHSQGHARPTENNPSMYNNQTSTSSNPRPSHSRASSSQSENDQNMYNSSSRTNDYRNPRPSGSTWSDRPRSQNNEQKRHKSRQTSNSAPAQEAPFTAREQSWTNPMSPVTPDIGLNDSPAPNFGTDNSPHFSTPDFNSTAPAFGSNERNFTSSTRTFSPADFTSDTRNFTSSPSTTRRDFSPNMPPGFIPRPPTGFSSSSSPPPTRRYRAAAPPSYSTWEHPCGPLCNEFCPDRTDRIARQIVEVDSDEEEEIQGRRRRRVRRVDVGSKGKGREASGETTTATTLRREASSDRAFRLALVRLGRPAGAGVGAAVDREAPSPARSVGSAYYTASEASFC